MWGWSALLNTSWRCIAFAPGCSISSMCRLWTSFVGQLPCREPTCVQGLIGLSALSHPLLCFAYRARPFPSISLSQEEGKTMMMMHPPLMDPAETVILSARETVGILHITYQPSWEEKGKGSHTSTDLPFFQGPLLKFILPCNICKSAWTWLLPSNPTASPTKHKAIWSVFIDFSEFQTKKINMKVISCEL